MPSNWSLCADAAAPTRLDDVLILKPLFGGKNESPGTSSLSGPCAFWSFRSSALMENTPTARCLCLVRWGLLLPRCKMRAESEEINQGGEARLYKYLYTDILHAVGLLYVHAHPSQMLRAPEKRGEIAAGDASENKRRKDVSPLDKTFNISRCI